MYSSDFSVLTSSEIPTVISG
jgi:hypothetical protein